MLSGRPSTLRSLGIRPCTRQLGLIKLMGIFAKIRDKLEDRIAEGIAASLTVFAGWVCYEIAPAVLSAIHFAVSPEVLLALLVTSLFLNVVFVWAAFAKRDALRVKYGIYWDREKNPHCPNCKIPIGAYGDYTSGKGYYCKPCKNIFRLTDVTGKDVDPNRAVEELAR